MIATGIKEIENRSWRTPYRGLLYIHAAVHMHPMRPVFGGPIPRCDLVRSAIIGRVTLVDVVEASASRWFQGPYGWVLENLTAGFVKRYFDDVCEGEVERHDLPNLLAVNFLLHRSLGGGGTSSLLLDAQGKTYAQYLLAAEVEVPEGLIARCEAAPGDGARQLST